MAVIILLVFQSRNDTIFDGVDWSTSRVFSQTMSRIQAMKKTIMYVLPPWYDVDTSDDLEFLQSHILAMKMSGNEDIPEETSRLLKV